MDMTHVQFAQPHWLWIGALVCAGTIALLARADRLGRRATAALAGTRSVSTVSRGRRFGKRALMVGGLAAAFVALARPQWGYRWETQRRASVDVMFAVDTSKSMRAEDLRPNRLTRAKLAVADLLRAFPDERTGLIAFAGEAFVQAPMTMDAAVFGEALDALDTDVIPRGGTNISSAIRTAVAAMASEPDRHKVLVILSDGEDLQGDAATAAAEAARASVVIYTVGVGTPAGEIVPIKQDGRRQAMLDPDGQPVHSRLDEPMLRRLAQITGGAYAALGPSGRGLEELYRQHLAQLPRRSGQEKMRKVYTEHFAIPLAFAVACLLLEAILGERCRRGRTAVPTAAAAAMLLALVGAAQPAAAATGGASPAKSAPSPTAATPTSTYNDGTAAYRKKDFAGAKTRFETATHTTDLGLQENAFYDLGNARFRTGEAAVAADHATAKAAWKDAIAAYNGALAIAPNDADARYNRDLVARRLAALEDEERHNPQKKDEKQAQNGQSGEKQQKQGGGKSSQDGGQQQASAQPQSGKQQGGQPNGQQQSGQQGSSSGQQQAGQQARQSPGPQQGEQQAQQSGQQGNAPQQAASGQGSAEQGHEHEQKSGPSEAGGQQANAEPPAAAPPGQQPNGGEEPRQPGSPTPGAPPASAASATARTAAPPPALPTPTPGGPGAISAGRDHTNGEPGGAVAAAERKSAGGLTRDEAAQLMNSVAGELQRLPTTDGRRGADDQQPVKDW
jgi:Ca-activated chloride channel homolog